MIVVQRPRGFKLLLRAANAVEYPAPAVAPINADVYWKYVDSADAPRLLGTYPMGARVRVPLATDLDRDIAITVNARSGTGVQHASDPADARSTVLQSEREQRTPTLAQLGEATHETAVIVIGNYHGAMRARHIQVSLDSAFGTIVAEWYQERDKANSEVPRLPEVVRVTSFDQVINPNAQTIYVRARHAAQSSPTSKKPTHEQAMRALRWGPWSNTLTITFADNLGDGGSSGTGNPYTGSWIDDSSTISAYLFDVPLPGEVTAAPGGGGGGGFGLQNVVSGTPTDLPARTKLRGKVQGGVWFEDDTTGDPDVSLIRTTGVPTGWRNVITDYGANNEAAADATTAIQAAIDAKGTIYIPEGSYVISAPLVLPLLDDTQSLIIKGAGINKTRLIYVGTGHGIELPGSRCDHWTLEDFQIFNIESTNTGNGIDGSNLSGVQTRARIERVMVKNFGGWGLFARNLQSSLINQCHFRGNNAGHICFEDDDVSEGEREPNANVISNCLLDNAYYHATRNKAAIRLYNANGTLIIGNTIQGQWIGGVGTKPAIHVDYCRKTHICQNHIEDGICDSAGILIENSRSVILESQGGSGLHAKDVEINNSQSIIFLNCNYQNDVPHIDATANCREILVYGGYFSNPTNLRGFCQAIDGMTVEGTTFQNQTTTQYVDKIDYWQNRQVQVVNYLVNGTFVDNTANWLGNYTGITRDATGGPEGGPCIVVDTQAMSDGGPVSGPVFYQEFNVPDLFPSGEWKLAFDVCIVNTGSPTNVLRYVDVDFLGYGLSGISMRITSGSPAYPVGRWFTQPIVDLLGAGTSRKITVSIGFTSGPSTPKVKFANFRLVRGRHTNIGDYGLRELSASDRPIYYAYHALDDGGALLDPGDYSVNTTTQLQAAMNAAATAKRALYLPGGDYYVSTLDVPAGLVMFGDGKKATRIKTTSNAPILRLSGGSRIQVRDIGFLGSNAGANQHAVFCETDAITNAQLDSLWIEDVGGSAVHIKTTGSNPASSIELNKVEAKDWNMHTPTGEVVPGVAGVPAFDIETDGPCVTLRNCRAHDTESVSAIGYRVRRGTTRTVLLDSCFSLGNGPSSPGGSVGLILGQETDFGDSVDSLGFCTLLNCAFVNWKLAGIEVRGAGSVPTFVGANYFKAGGNDTYPLWFRSATPSTTPPVELPTSTVFADVDALYPTYAASWPIHSNGKPPLYIVAPVSSTASFAGITQYWDSSLGTPALRDLTRVHAGPIPLASLAPGSANAGDLAGFNGTTWTNVSPTSNGVVNAGAAKKLAYYPSAGNTVDDAPGAEVAPDSTTDLRAIATANSKAPLAVRGASGQLEPLIRFEDTGGTARGGISPNGRGFFVQSNTASAARWLVEGYFGDSGGNLVYQAYNAERNPSTGNWTGQDTGHNGIVVLYGKYSGFSASGYALAYLATSATEPTYRLGFSGSDGTIRLGGGADAAFTTAGVAQVEVVGTDAAKPALRAKAAASQTAPILDAVRNDDSRVLALAQKGWQVMPVATGHLTTSELPAGQFALGFYNGKIVLARNNAGTIEYLSIAVDASTATWTAGTAAP